MRKNKSSKEPCLLRSKGSRARQISIQLEASLLQKGQKQKDQSTSNHYRDMISEQKLEDNRMDNSSNWQNNVSLSNNILKQIMNYSNIPAVSNHSASRAKKSSTVAVYEKESHQKIVHSNKSKKASLGELNWERTVLGKKKNSHRLVINETTARQIEKLVQQNISNTPKEVCHRLLNSKDFSACSNQLSEKLIADSLEIREQQKQLQKIVRTGLSLPGSPERRTSSQDNLNPLHYDWSYKKYSEMQKKKEQLAVKADELHIMEGAICKEYSQVVDFWEQMMKYQQMIGQIQPELVVLSKKIQKKKEELEMMNEKLFQVNKSFVANKRLVQYRSSGHRDKVLFQAQRTHQQLIRRLTIRDFEETVLFNIKVAIPNHKNKNSVIGGIYEQLFKSKCAKKFTMILKKHSTQMDLYDGKLLTEFIKKINDLEQQYLRIEVQDNSGGEDGYYREIQQIVEQIQGIRLQLEKFIGQQGILSRQYERYQESYRDRDRKINEYIEEINFELRSDYERQTEKQADFKSLIIKKYINKYKELKQLRKQRASIFQEIKILQDNLDSINLAMLN